MEVLKNGTTPKHQKVDHGLITPIYGNIQMEVFFPMGDPQVTMGFNTRYSQKNG